MVVFWIYNALSLSFAIFCNTQAFAPMAVAPREDMAATKILCQSSVMVTAAFPLHPKPTAPEPTVVAAAEVIEVGILANADLMLWMCSLVPSLASVAASTANDACVVVVVGGFITSEPQND